MASNSKFLAELLDSNGDVNTANLDNLSSTLGTASTNDTGDFLQVSNNLSDLNNATTARSSLGLGTAATTAATDYATAAQGATADTALQPTNNLNDLGDVSTALTNLGFSTFGKSIIDDTSASAVRTTLGLGTAATTNSTAYATAAQGTKADTALQPTNNLNDLNNADTALTNLGFSAFGKSLIDDIDASVMRETINVYSKSEVNSVVNKIIDFNVSSPTLSLAVPNISENFIITAVSAINTTITSVVYTVDGGSENIVSFTGTPMTLPITLTGTAGDVNILNFRVVDSYGNSSSTISKTITLANEGIFVPTFSNLVSGDFVEEGIDIQLNPFETIGGSAETHVSTDWQLATDASFSNVIYQSLADTTNKLTNSFLIPNATTNTNYYLRTQFNGANYGASGWSEGILLTTIATFAGESVFTTAGTYTWIAPPGLFRACVLCVGAGSNGATGSNAASGNGGGGGSLKYSNLVDVVSGQSYTVVVGSPSSALGSTSNDGDRQGNGGGGGANGSSQGQSNQPGGGGGAAGYSGNGGRGSTADGAYGTGTGAATSGSGGGGGGGWSQGASGGDGGGGGGVGLYGEGANGAAGSGSSAGGGYGGSGGSNANNATGGSYGGGGGGGYTTSSSGGGTRSGGSGGSGAVRIMWGYGRSFPNDAA